MDVQTHRCLVCQHEFPGHLEVMEHICDAHGVPLRRSRALATTPGRS